MTSAKLYIGGPAMEKDDRCVVDRTGLGIANIEYAGSTCFSDANDMWAPAFVVCAIAGFGFTPARAAPQTEFQRM